MYGTNTLRGRKDASQFHAAGTLNIGGGLSLEIGVVENKIAAKGVRPVLTYAAGPLTARLGFEAGKYAAVGYDFGGFKLTGNVANGKRDAATRNNQSAFALTAAVSRLAVGVIAGKTEAAVGEDKVRTVYASHNLPLFDIKGASVTPALSSSTGKTAAGVETKENSFRLHLNYAF